MHDLSQQFAEVLTAIIGIFMSLLVPGAIIALLLCREPIDRGRIRSNLAGYGWQVLNVRRKIGFFEFFSRSSRRRYRVTYQTHTGAIIEAECTTSWLEGVRWVSYAPFGL